MKLNKFSFTAALAAFAATAAFAADPNPWDDVNLKGRTDKANPVGYKVGEPIVFTLSTENLDLSALDASQNYRISWTRTGDDGIKEEGTSALRVGDTCWVTTRLDRAGFVRLEARVVGGAGYWVQRSKAAKGSPNWAPVKTVSFDGGAGVEIDKIQPDTPDPADFDAYWAKQKEILNAVLIEATYIDVKPKAPDWFNKDCSARAVSVTCAGKRPVTGYLFMPENAAAKSCKARLAVQGYGTWPQSCPWWGARKDEIFLEINAHGYDMERDRAYYNDFTSKLAPAGYSYAFSPEENANPDTAYFHDMAMRVMRALQFLKSLPEWNGKDLIVEGGSQGGLQTSWAAGLDPDVSLARPSITWCSDLKIDKSPNRLKANWRIAWAEGLTYYDAMNHIKRAKCPIEITRAGLGDYTCPPSTLAVYYNAIPTDKSIHWVQGSQHGFIPPDPNQSFDIGTHKQTEAESKSQSASDSVK